MKRSPLFRATREAVPNLEKIEKLFKKGANPNELDDKGVPLVVRSATHSQHEVASLFFKYGLNMQEAVEAGFTETPERKSHLLVALADKPEILRRFIHNGLDLNSIHHNISVFEHLWTYNYRVAELFSQYNIKLTGYRLGGMFWSAACLQCAHTFPNKEAIEWTDELYLMDGVLYAKSWNDSLQYLMDNTTHVNDPDKVFYRAFDAPPSIRAKLRNWIIPQLQLEEA